MHSEEEKQIIRSVCRQVVEYFANYETEQAAVDNSLKVINGLQPDFGGNSSATLAQQPKQLFAYYHAVYVDATQLQNINAAITEISLKAKYDDLDNPGIDVLYVIYKLFNKSRSKNWSAEKKGYLYSTPASLNNRLAIEILRVANVRVVGLDVLLERQCVYFMQSLLYEMQQANPLAGYTDTLVEDESYLSTSELNGFQYDNSSNEELLDGNFILIGQKAVHTYDEDIESEEGLLYQICSSGEEQHGDGLNQDLSGEEKSLSDTIAQEDEKDIYRPNITASIDDDNLSGHHSSSASPRAPGW